jgi:putative ABC transport system permease protein
MTLLKRLAAGLGALIWKTRTERELDEELRTYLDIAIEQKISAGLPRDAATRAARAEIGSVEAIKDNVREVGWEIQLDTCVRDLRFGVRSFLRSPRFTVPALMTLALGIGATAAMFSVMRTVLLEPLPYREPDRIVAVWETTRGGANRNAIAPANFVVWCERARTLEHLGMVGPRTAAMILDGQPRQVAGAAASSEVYRALAVQPALGRVYTAEEDARNDVIILSHEFWQGALGSRADVLGMSLTTDGERRIVIGIMPPRFTIAGQKADFLVPYGVTIEQFRSGRGRGGSYALARLRDGVSFEDAYSEMRIIYAALEKEEPQRNAGRTVMLFRLEEQMVGEIRPALLTLTAAVALVLVVACVNVANLLLARSAARRREVSMRTALGAGRGRLVRQMLTESLLLAVAGGVAGLGVAALLHRGILAIVGDRIPIPRLDQVTLDLRVVVFTMVVALATGVAFGLVPALISVSSASDALREGGRHAGGRRLHRVLNTLVVAEVAISLVLLVGAGLFMRSFINQRSIDTGYRSEGVLTARVQLPRTRLESSRASGVLSELLARLSSLPGVQQAAAASCLPPPGGCAATTVWRLDVPTPPDDQGRSSQIRPVSPAFFRTMAISHLAGRDFSNSDTADSTPVAIVSESVVREFFGGENPLGAQLHINNIDHANGSAEMPWSVVGIVRDIRSSVDGTASRIVYVPIAQMPGRNMTFFLRTHRDPTSLVASVTRVVHSMEPEAPVDVRTLDHIVAGTIARPRAVTVLVGAFALIALALAAIGVYGVIAYTVRERTQEIGLRLALGATAMAVGRLVLGHAMRLAVMGVVTGLIVASVLTRLIQRLLFDVEPLDPWTFALTPLVLLIVATVASYVPARRGMRTAPADVLRAN